MFQHVVFNSQRIFQYIWILCWIMLKHVETCWNQLAMMRFLAVCCGSSTFPSIWLHTAIRALQRTVEAPFPFALEIQPLLRQSCEAKNGCFNQGVKNGWWVDFFNLFFVMLTPWLPRSSLDSRWYAQRWGTENLGSRRRAPNFPCETWQRAIDSAPAPTLLGRAIPSVASRHVASGRRKALAVRNSVVHSWSKLECCHCNGMRLWVSMDHYMKIVDTHQLESCWWIKKKWSAMKCHWFHIHKWW